MPKNTIDPNAFVNNDRELVARLATLGFIDDRLSAIINTAKTNGMVFERPLDKPSQRAICGDILKNGYADSEIATAKTSATNNGYGQGASKAHL